MERLTYRDEFGRWTADVHYGGVVDHLRDVPIDRLAAYEDTGLEPEEINVVAGLASENCSRAADAELDAYRSIGPIKELSALVKARDEGRVVVLPCEFGDTVYVLMQRGGKTEVAQGIVRNVRRYEKDNTWWLEFSNLWINKTLDDFGTTVFLTRQEAEAAQSGGGGDDA